MKYICLITYFTETINLEHCHKYKKLAILLKVTLLRQRFSLFLNCANGTKSSKASHIFLLLLQLLLRYHYLYCRERMNHEQMGKHTIQCLRRATHHTCVFDMAHPGRASAKANTSYPDLMKILRMLFQYYFPKHFFGGRGMGQLRDLLQIWLLRLSEFKRVN